MDTNNKVIAAVDVSTNKVVVVIGTLNERNNLQVLGWGEAKSEGVIKGEACNVSAIAHAINEASIKASERAHPDVVIEEVYACAVGMKVQSLEVKIERTFDDCYGLTTEDLSDMLNEAMQSVKCEKDSNIYHVEPQEFEVDGEQVWNPHGMVGENFNGNYRMFVAKSSYVKKLKIALDKSYLRMDNFVMDPITSGYSLLSDEDKEAGVVLLEIGAGVTKMAIYTNGYLRYIQSMPFAGNVLTDDLTKECSIGQRSAESLKVLYGEALSEQVQKDKLIVIGSENGWEEKEIGSKMLAAILENRLKDFMKWVAHHVRKSGYEDCIGAGVVLAGGTAKMKKITTFMKFHLGMDVRIGIPRIQGAAFKELESPAYASVLGLLQYALDDQMFNLDFEQAKIAARKKAKKKVQQRKAKQKSSQPSLLGKVMDKVANSFDSVFSTEDNDELN